METMLGRMTMLVRMPNGCRMAVALLVCAAVGATLCGAASAKKLKALSEPPAIADVVYGAGATEQLTVYPSALAGATSVLLVHGGGWHTQTHATELPSVAEELQSAGFAVFDADYPQDSSSQPAFPMEPNAILAAAEWVRANAGAYGGSTANIVFLGGSAGGQLVEMTATRFPAKGVVSLSGPTNILALEEMAERKELKDGLGGDVRDAPGCGGKATSCSESLALEFSPVDNIPASCPPYMLFSSQKDEVPESQQFELEAALEAADCPVQLEVLAGNQHSFQYWPKVKAAVESFIASH
jgi:acetyl esterase/lipase